MSSKLFGVFVIFVSLAAISCGPANVAKVKGKVTLDGKPLENADITFYPEEKGLVSSNGTTNAEGVYELNYDSQTKGAALGKHKVLIRLGVPEEMPDVKPKPLPAIYNKETTLTAEVVAGDNAFDFDLKSNP